MSTRTQIQIQGGINNDCVVLYHHCDGYPEYIIPLLHRAFHSQDKNGRDLWQLTRGGKSASVICSADPMGFDVEVGTELHPDIEYFYVVTVGATKGRKPTWKVEAYTVNIPWDLDGSVTFERIKKRFAHKIMSGNINTLNGQMKTPN